MHLPATCYVRDSSFQLLLSRTTHIFIETITINGGDSWIIKLRLNCPVILRDQKLECN